MMLTLFADASFCPKTKAAGWGSWAMRDGWSRGKFLGGPIRRDLSTSNAAELCGLAGALWQHDKDGDLQDVKVFMLQCDNVVALGYILRHIKTAQVSRLKNVRQAQINYSVTNNKLCLEALAAIETVVGERAVLLRHVKGHSGADDGRSWVNEQCDAEARKHMVARRAEIYASQHLEVLT